MDEIVWTNDGWLFGELGLHEKKIFLWKIWLRTPEMLAVPNKEFDHAWDAQILKSMPGWQQAEHIWLIDTEAMAPDHMMDDPRVHLWDSTSVSHPRVHPYWFWFDWCREIEEHMNHADMMVHPNDKQPEFLFELLLGRNKPTRTMVYDRVRNDGYLEPRTLISYTGRGTHWIPGMEVDVVENVKDFKKPIFYNAGSIHNSMEALQIPFHDKQTANLCCFVPRAVYDMTWYTMLVETHQCRVFFSEKTAKPLLGRRIFVAVHAFPGALKLLRDMGFRTFGSVIDESYDDILDYEQRLDAALEQCRELAKLDPRKVYRDLAHDLEHNRQLLLSYRGIDEMKKQMESLLK